MDMVVAPVEQFAAVGGEALRVLESVIGLLGPFRLVHPQWKQIEEEALSSLTPEHSELAREMVRAIRLHRDAQARLGKAKHELEKLDESAFYPEPAGFIFRELRRHKLVDYLGPAGDPPFKVLGSAEEMRAVGYQVLKSKMRFALRVRDIAVKCELEARPAIAAAEHGLIVKWVEEQRATLEPLVAEFRGLVTKHKLELAAVAEPVTKTLVGRWSGSSHCEAILEMMSEAAPRLSAPSFSETLRPVLSRVNWKLLRHQFEAELGTWQSRHAGKRAAPKGLRPMDYIFARVIVEAGGKRLTVKEIFASAVSNPRTAHKFRAKTMNSNHRRVISSLAGYRTEDGFVIRKEGEGYGDEQSLWGERVVDPASADGAAS